MNDKIPSRRTVRRHKVFQPGHWSSANGAHALHLLDISMLGARAHAASPPRIGDDVVIACGATLGLARVKWVSASNFGLRFSAPISGETINAVAEVTPGKPKTRKSE